MNFVAQLEDYLRDLGAEARKKHPGVKEASERAILKLRTLQNAYVSAVRKASSANANNNNDDDASNKGGRGNTTEKHPDTTLFRSSDLLHPFLLATNYPNASPKLLDTSFKAMKTLMEANAICPGDGMNLIRVWMIQAQVVVSYSTREQSSNATTAATSTSTISSTTFGSENNISSGGLSNNLSNTSDGISSANSQSASSWFGGFLSSSSVSSSASSAAAAASSNLIMSPKKMTTAALSAKSVVSSSHGQAGSGGHTQKDLEKLALDILSCLLQLLELRDLPVTQEQWIQSVTLCCLLYLPAKQTVRQAAQSTLPQVLSLLVQQRESQLEEQQQQQQSTNDDSNDDASSCPSTLAVKTWEDLLICASYDPYNYISNDDYDEDTPKNKKKSKSALHGAFSNCKWGEKDAALAPSPSLSFELMMTILKEAPHLFNKVAPITLEVVLKIFQQQQRQQQQSNNALVSPTMPLESVRLVQFVSVILQTQCKNIEWLIECRELVNQVLIPPIQIATEALRKQPEFEDGFAYKVPNRSLKAYSNSIGGNGSSSSSSNGPLVNTQNLETIRGLPPAVLWKATLALEALKAMVQDENMRPIWVHADVIVHLLESASDFCTIGASCEDHMNLLVIACRDETQGLSYEAETLPLDMWNGGKHKNDSYILGDALWIGLNTVLKMIDSLNEELLEVAFAPALAVLQHYLKRFPASGTIVKRALEGYFSLSKTSLDHPLLRRALLTSLCKLSLPQWGTHDPTCLLKDHNIAALICLLNVVHRYYDSIGPEWSIILQTFQELSVLAIASPHVSDGAYVGALSISAVFSRFAAFSTCLSDESLTHFVEGLREVSLVQSPGIVASPVRGADILRIPDKGVDNFGREERESIGERLMNIGVRAIYGSTDGNQHDDVPIAERTKNTFYHDYQMDFCRRLSASKHPVRLDEVPFSFSLLADVAMTNSFRHSRCGGTILKQLCVLAAEAPTTRHFSMDAVAMLILPMISGDDSLPTSFTGPGKIMYKDPRQNQYLAVERENETSPIIDSVSQVDLLRPLCNCIRTVNVSSVAEAGVQALHSLLENCGDNLSPDAWTEVIQAVASLPSGDRAGPEWANSCLVGFRCLKLIVDDFLNHTDGSMSTRTSLLDCCSSFGSSFHDVNTSLTAVGLLWTIADQDAGTAAIDLALSKLVQLSSDPRAEVRNCAVNTLFSCIVVRGQTFSASQWQTCICNMVFGVYDLVTSKINNDGDGDGEKKQTSPAGKSRYRVSVHHSRDSAGKQWVATQALVLRGLCRVLRNSFSFLLDTTDDGSGAKKGNEDTPWFDDAWNKLLGYAFEAATQVGGRDTLDLRNSGVELLVLCNQLACSAGVQAAITPARVGTNMEVVNGALRSVRTPEKISPEKEPPRRSHSVVTDMWRENLFLDAFDVLDSYQDYLESDNSSHNEPGLNPYMEPTQVQVLSKFAGDLSKLYDCCKENEFLEDKEFSQVKSFEKQLSQYSSPPGDNDALVERFVRLILTVATKSSSGPDARFLSQAQRSCIDLFRSMATYGSPEALISLTLLAGTTFFRERDENGKAKKGIDILCHEASTVLHEEISSADVSDECRVLVLCRVLSIYLDECAKGSDAWASVDVNISYSLLVKIFTLGCKSAEALEGKLSEAPNTAKKELLDILWKKVSVALASMLSPISDDKNPLSIIHPDDLVNIVYAASRFAPSSHTDELCAVLSSGAKKCLEIVTMASANGSKETLAQQQTTLNLFGACFAGVCRLNPNYKHLHSIADNVLSSALRVVEEEGAPDKDDVNIHACLSICRAMQDTEGVESIVIAVFNKLCQLVGADDSRLRRVVGGVLARVNVGRILTDTRRRCEEAEQRAEAAESRVSQLTRQIEELTKEKAALESQLAVF